jgi:excisionase family DNA binding protein
MNEILLNELSEIKRYTLLSAKNMLTFEDVLLLTGLSKSYLYKLTCKHAIPFYRPNGKQVYFDKKEIEAWLRQNRIATESELENKAITYLTTGRK